MRCHLDTDFLVYALGRHGPERQRLLELSESDEPVEICAVAWYEFCRGPRTPQELAVGRSFFVGDGIIPFSEELAVQAAELFRQLGSPRKRVADIAIAATARAFEARLLTRNERDFADVPGVLLEVVR